MTSEEKQKAIDALKISVPFMAVTQEEFNDYIQTLNKIVDLLEQEPCEDCISCEAVLNTMRMVYRTAFISDNEYMRTMKLLKSLPPVQPKQRTGHWIDTGSGQECSECGEIQYGYDSFRRYCANCGSKIGGDEE